MRQRKERDGLCLLSAVPKIQCDSNPHCSSAIRLWETFTFTNEKWEKLGKLFKKKKNYWQYTANKQMNGNTCRGNQSSTFLPPFDKMGSTLKGKNLRSQFLKERICSSRRLLKERICSVSS